MRTMIALAASLSTLACSSARPVAFQAPAASDALSCALSEATALGYYPLEGGIGDGFIKMARPTEYTTGEAAQEVTARVLSVGLIGSNRQTMDHLTITGAGGILRVQVVGLDEQGEMVNADEAAVGRARAVLAACSEESA